MTGRGSSGHTARLLCAAAILPFVPAPAYSQTAPQPPAQNRPPELDPSAPLAPLPDIGVAWPDLNAKDQAPPATAVTTKGQAVAAPSLDEGGGQIRYNWAIEGITSLGNAEELLKAFRQQSALEADRKDAANAAQIGRRSLADADLLTQLLRAQGYYDAVVEPRTERSGGTIRVVLTADPGEQYRFVTVDLPGLAAAGPETTKLREAFAVKAGDPVIASDVIAAGAALTRALGQNGFAQAKVGEQQIEVNHQTHFASLVLPVTSGPIARFGSIRVSGQPPFGAHHVAIIARFRPGDLYKQSKVEDLRRALIATTLVSSADIQLVPVNGGRVVDLAVHLEPAPSHTIAGELGYGTGQGARAEVDWTDRNFFNPEGALTLRAVGGTLEQLGAVQFRRSNFLRRDQVLNLQASAGHQKFDAYEAKTISLSGNIERQSNFIWQKKWTWTYGAEVLGTDEQGAFDRSGIKDTRKFFIAALPLGLGYDGSDNLLDPTRANRCERISPSVRNSRGRGQNPARHDLWRFLIRHCAVAAFLFGRRRIGPGLWLSAARAQGRRRRSYWRAWPCRVRAGDAHPPEAVRRQFRHRAIFRRRLADDQGAAELRQLAFGRGTRRPILFELRSDPHRSRGAAQPPEG
jgi:translocation and assembly module TamA